MAERLLQPLLHDLVALLRAPTQVWSGADGQIRPVGAQGVFHGDVRVLSAAVLTVDGREPETVASVPTGVDAATFVGLSRHLGDPVPDPTVRVQRRRVVAAGHLEEQIDVVSTAQGPVTAQVCLRLSCDLASIEQVKIGRPSAPVAAQLGSERVRWAAEGTTVELTGHGAAVSAADGEVVLRWAVQVAPRTSATVAWSLRASDTEAVVAAPAGGPTWTVPSVVADDRRLPALVARSLADLDGLRMVTREAPDQPFLAAGAPWFFTLFGRDSLWAARFLLPLGTELAASTLRVLAGRQGTTVDAGTAEEPGKVLHEVRRGSFELAADQAGTSLSLPPVYYGTVDATPLWVCLLHDAWRWGLPPEQVAPLLPTAEAALRWMADYGDADGDGFLEYVDRSGSGLTNQGWKDSGDSVQWRDGRLADAPIALAEVQGYAYEAAVGGAALLDAFDRPGADRWREWAAALAERFRTRFWVEDPAGAHPAIALDAAGRPVDSMTSNVGHLLGTGLLDETETLAVARRLSAEDMDSGFGVRTMSTTAAGYGPLSYHGGSVWPHDSAIVLTGLARAGCQEAASGLVEGLLAAGSAFDYRLPELFGGDARAALARPVPYPAACRPQAWAAAAGVAVLQAVLGLRPDAPAGRLEVAPLVPSPVGAVRAEGLRFAGQPLTVEIDRAGAVTSLQATGTSGVGGPAPSAGGGRLVR